MKIIAHKAQVVLVADGTIVEDETGTEAVVTDDHGIQIGSTFFLTENAWAETWTKNADLKALVLRPAA